MTRRIHKGILVAAALALALVSFAGVGEQPDEIVPFVKIDDGAKSIDDLRAREISLPQLGPDDICPVLAFPEPVFEGAGPGVRAGVVGAVGIGVNGVLHFGGQAADGWSGSKILWVMDPDLPPLLVRGRRIDGRGQVHFRTSGDASASSLVLDEDVQSSIGPELRDQPSSPRVRESGCYALQIDGPDFQSVIVFRAIVGDDDAPVTRRFELRDLQLDGDEAVAFGFHPTRDPVTIETSVDGLEVCPADLAAVFEGTQTVQSYWFDVCLPLEKAVPLELPPPLVDHIALLVRSMTDAPVREARVTINYVPGDEFFHLAPSPLDPDERSAALVITPSSWDVVAADPTAGAARAVVRQHGAVVPVVQVDDAARGGIAHGPVALGDAVVIRVHNSSQERQAVSVALYWS